MASRDTPMDNTFSIRNVPDSVREEYKRVIQQRDVNQPREARTEQFQVNVIPNLSTQTQDHLAAIFHREKIHFQFMQRIIPMAYERRYGRPMPDTVKQHDHSKDKLFAFILAMSFDVFIGDHRDTELKDKLSSLVKVELDRHYSLEPHHPQHEQLTGNECTPQDILEMSLDRLARNVQFNAGQVNSERMKKFPPEFYLGDVEEKKQMYCDNVSEFKDMVQQCAMETYFSSS